MSHLFRDQPSDGFDYRDDDACLDDIVVRNIVSEDRRGDAIQFFNLLVQCFEGRSKEWGRCTSLWRGTQIKQTQHRSRCFWNGFDMQPQRIVWIEGYHTIGALVPENVVSRL